MANKRTTLILDDESRTAAHQLSDHYGCTVSEAIRRSLIAQRAATGVTKRTREQRVRTLKRLFEIFDGNDAADEVRRLKSEDQGF